MFAFLRPASFAVMGASLFANIWSEELASQIQEVTEDVRPCASQSLAEEVRCIAHLPKTEGKVLRYDVLELTGMATVGALVVAEGYRELFNRKRRREEVTHIVDIPASPRGANAKAPSNDDHKAA